MGQKTNNTKFPSTLEEIILLTVKGRPEGIYGLDVLNAINIEKIFFGKKKITVGSLYPALKSLERQGLINGRWGDDDLVEENSGAARRKYYTISAEGITALREIKEFRSRLDSFNTDGLQGQFN
jgi:PadR family transcriptional regulator, regulatory protein PadR